MGGDLTSEPYRMMAAETLSYWIERTQSYYDEEVPIVVMGDFNDEPFNRSMTDYALGLKDSDKVKSKRSQNPYLFNLTWGLQGDGIGTYYYDRWNMLDQILVNRPLLRAETQLQIVADSCEIFKPAQLLKSGKPRRFGRPSKSTDYDPDGYSDHLPIFCRISE